MIPSCTRLSLLSSMAPCPGGEVITSMWTITGGLGRGAACLGCGWVCAAQPDSTRIAPTSTRRFMPDSFMSNDRPAGARVADAGARQEALADLLNPGIEA